MITRKKFYFVRHGSTDWNVKKLCQGQRDIPLNELGRGEARAIGALIRNLEISKICSSPLKRALETAQIIHSAIPSIPLEIIDQLMERSWGELEGIPSAEMYRIEEQEELDPNFKIGNGVEDRFALQTRLIEGFNRALEGDGAPLIVSHGRVFLTLCDLLNLPRTRQIPNSTPVLLTPIGSDDWIMSNSEN